MKKYISILILFILIFNFGCAATLRTDSNIYQSYGVLNKDEIKSEDVLYRVSIGNIILAVLFSETIIVPAYIILFEFMEPYALKNNENAEMHYGNN